MSFMLDTNICIYAIKKRPPQVLRRVYENMESGLFISSVTLAELRYGVEKSDDPDKNNEALKKFAAILKVLPFERDAAVEYGKIRAFLNRRGTPIGPLDTLIAAHAKSVGMTLITHNVGEFQRVPGLKVADWAEE